jgi:hypothetical protein
MMSELGCLSAIDLNSLLAVAIIMSSAEALMADARKAWTPFFLSGMFGLCRYPCAYNNM